jgi:hypothetical protein
MLRSREMEGAKNGRFLETFQKISRRAGGGVAKENFLMDVELPMFYFILEVEMFGPRPIFQFNCVSGWETSSPSSLLHVNRANGGIVESRLHVIHPFIMSRHMAREMLCRTSISLLPSIYPSRVH